VYTDPGVKGSSEISASIPEQLDRHRRKVHVSSALFGDADELLLSCFVVDQRKGRLMKLEGPRLLELFLHSATAFEG
jgi:hypothetical protein